MLINGKLYGSLDQLEADAAPLIDDSALGYLRSGAESEATLTRNLTQWGEWRFLPRCLVNVSKASTTCSILGRESSMPVMVAPMAMQRLANAREGECGMARGSKNAGVPMLLSTMSTTPMVEVAEVGCDSLFFQLYCLKDRNVTRRLIEQADRLGCFRGIVITVDAPVLGKREADEQTQFKLPEEFELSILAEEGVSFSMERARMESGDGSQTEMESRFGSDFGSLIDDTLDWSVITFCRSITKLPIILKGILSAEDAKLAVKHGVDAIVVSNHGGRQLDYSVGTLDVLEDVSRAVRGRCEVWLDGGVRRGSDIIKAIALGADAVLIGRPLLWALALGGSDGVEAALRELQRDVLRTMKLLGVTSIAEVRKKGRNFLRPAGN